MFSKWVMNISNFVTLQKKKTSKTRINCKITHGEFTSRLKRKNCKNHKPFTLFPIPADFYSLTQPYRSEHDSQDCRIKKSKSKSRFTRRFIGRTTRFYDYVSLLPAFFFYFLCQQRDDVVVLSPGKLGGAEARGRKRMMLEPRKPEKSALRVMAREDAEMERL